MCRMFNQTIAKQPLPKYIFTDHNPLFHFHRWLANLRVLGIEEMKTVPFVPQPHPFPERVIGTLRREYLDHLFFWNEADLGENCCAIATTITSTVVTGLNGETPNGYGTEKEVTHATLDAYEWRTHCHGMFQLSVTA